MKQNAVYIYIYGRRIAGIEFFQNFHLFEVLSFDY